MPATAVDSEHRVTPRELFFDLVFVFGFTQVATLLTDDPTFAGMGRGVLVLAALWWAWAAYAWLTNVVDPEDGVVGAALLVSLIAMFVAALVVPGVFDDDGVLFGAGFLVVCAMHLVLFALAGSGSRDLLGAVLRLAPIVGIVLFAFAMKTIVGHVGDELDAAAAFALCGGSAVFLLTFSAMRIRIERRVSRGRFVAALVFLLVLPLATMIPALAALALVAAVWLALHTYELVWWREARAESRSALASP